MSGRSTHVTFSKIFGAYGVDEALKFKILNSNAHIRNLIQRDFYRPIGSTALFIFEADVGSTCPIYGFDSLGLLPACLYSRTSISAQAIDRDTV